MSKIIGIYCIKNIINDKKYIGKSNDVMRRMHRHKYELKNNKHINLHLQYAVNKYGLDSFIFYLLEECTLNDIDERELYYISLFNTTSQEYGYNIELGGRTGHILSDETKQKISKALTGRRLSDEHRQKIGDANSKRVLSKETRQKIGNANRNPSDETRRKIGEASKCRTHSKETKNKISEKMKGINHPNLVPVYCPELNEYFDYINQANERYNIPKTGITCCLSGRQKTAGKHPITGEKLHWVKVESN